MDAAAAVAYAEQFGRFALEPDICWLSSQTERDLVRVRNATFRYCPRPRAGRKIEGPNIKAEGSSESKFYTINLWSLFEREACLSRGILFDMAIITTT
ncbi:hypothetical protein GJ744_000447 [Endocarpon pusillum]|uniref:Uncharacterized protein n=1 Tax=Endocarpon pusillum TaxID=364733 RepID=A0A8H7AER6_9EURO|nr:hypothetical protein GJ744_000447 [Endocarpon pusillum]